jgi:cysteine desulfurase / selenocysteine lyase
MNTATGTYQFQKEVAAIRSCFPILGERVNGRPLVYFDNAATTQKPQVVIDAISNYYSKYNSNVHRGVHHLSQVATEVMENSRKKVAAFINASSESEVIFTSGTTDSINMVAQILTEGLLQPGDEILLSEMEHHSNIVPWQMACQKSGAILRVIRVTDSGEIDMDSFEQLLNEKTKVVSIVHVSNALGTINPVEEIIKKAKSAGALVLLDGAQAVAHLNVDVQKLGCDFYTFSGHKLYGPTGIGILYGKSEWLEKLPPYRGGGEMIETVSFEKTTYNTLPFKYEAGTPNIAGIIGLGAAIDWVTVQEIELLAAHENALLHYATSELNKIEDLEIIGTAANKVSVVSFNITGIHHYDLGVLLDKMGIALRTGHHCTQPLMARFGITGTARASMAAYNTFEEIDALVAGIKKAKNMLL